MHRRARILCATSAGLLTLALAGCNLAERDDEGNVIEAGSVGARNLQLGDCFQDGDISAEEETEVRSVDAVPCDDPHDNEVYAVFDLPDGDYPGDAEVIELAISGCEDEFADFVGLGYGESSLDVTYLYPLETTWENDREVVCAVYDAFGPATGTLAGQGEAYRFAVEGECMDDAGLVADCAAEHYAEMYLETELPDGAFPGAQAVDDAAYQLCYDAFTGYVGIDWESSALDFVYWTPDEASWDAGFRLVSCGVTDPAGSLTGSVEGSVR